MLLGLSFDILDFIGLFLFLAGFIVGLGAVTVIDVHGLLSRKSAYWTETIIRIHKVTKPLIWLGVFLVITGGLIFYRAESFSHIPLWHAMLAILIVLNGCFLSFKVSPYLTKREKEGRANEILPAAWQRKTIASLVVSVFSWWGSLLLLVLYLVGT